MSNLIKNLVSTARHFTAFDFAVFKICLLSIGILLGTYFSCFFGEFIGIVWGIAFFTYILLLLKVIKYYKKR